MTLRELYDFIYQVPKDTPHCGHCGRPLFLITENGKQYLVCKRCRELAANGWEDQDDLPGKKHC